MKNIYYYIIACIVSGVLILSAAFVLPNIVPDRTTQDPRETVPQNQENLSAQPEPDVHDTPPEGTPYLDIGDAAGRSILFSPDDQRYPAIEAECCERIRCINAQIKTGFSRAELDAMKRNGTYVAITFSEPTTFVTSYIVDGSPREITIDGMVSFLDLKDWSENDIITPAQGGPGVWHTSRDCGELRDLVAPILRELQGENG